uniref:Uncharacterized protein n=1 Tax=Manihot esculenta TaxID=3983 RepID=A0A2C9WBU0_MANES
MILAAIAALDEKNGSNKTSMSKMKSTGELLFWKNNYMKADTNAPPRRGRGRPPKPKTQGRPPKDQNAPPKPAPTGSGKPRGRPRKIAQSMEQMNGTTTATVPQ